MQHVDNMLPKRRTLLIVAVSLITGMILASGLFIFLSNSAQPKGTTEGLTLVGNVSLRAYHSDGALFYSAGGHNEITLVGANNLIACFVGVGQVLYSGGTSSCSAYEPTFQNPATLNPLVAGVWINNQVYTETDSVITTGTPFGTVPPSSSYTNYPTAFQTASDISTQVAAGKDGCPSSASGGSCIGWNVTGVVNPTQICSISATSAIIADFLGCSPSIFPYTVLSAGVGYWPSTSGSGFSSTIGVTQFDAINLCTSTSPPTPSGCQAQSVTLNSGDSLQVTVAFIVSS